MMNLGVSFYLALRLAFARRIFRPAKTMKSCARSGAAFGLPLANSFCLQAEILPPPRNRRQQQNHLHGTSGRPLRYGCGGLRCRPRRFVFHASPTDRPSAHRFLHRPEQHDIHQLPVVEPLQQHGNQ